MLTQEGDPVEPLDFLLGTIQGTKSTAVAFESTIPIPRQAQMQHQSSC